MAKISQYIIGGIISYFVTLLFDIVLFGKRREIQQSSAVMHIDRPGWYWDIVIYSLISCIVFIIIFSIFRYFIRRKFNLLQVSLIIIVFSLISATVTSGINSLIPKVSGRTVVRGCVATQGEYSYLFVRPISSNRCWLQDPIPLIQDSAGKWQTMAWFGGMEGQEFELIAISSKTPLHPIPFGRPGSYDCDQIPSKAERFVRLVRLK